MLDLLHISKDFIFVLLAVAERRDSVLIALRKRFGIRTLKSFLMILNYFFFFSPDEKLWRSKMNGDVGVSRNNCNVSFLHSKKSDIWTAVAEVRGEIIMSLYSPKPMGICLVTLLI